jgi:cell division protein FtsL
MNELDFEYAIRRDVRNNRIVREVDRARARELWRWAGVGALVVLVLLFTALQHFELIRYGYRLERLRAQRVEEERINRQLKLEIQTLRAPQWVERIAIRDLKLVAPPPERTVVIERVSAPAPPDKGIVASR